MLQDAESLSPYEKVDDGRIVERSDVSWEMYEGSVLAEWSSSIPIGVGNFGRIQI